MRRRYQNRLSGPLMDRVDLQVDLPAVRSGTLLDTVVGEASAEVAKRVSDARSVAADRWREFGRSNATVPSSVLRRPPYRLARKVLHPLTQQVDHGTLSARGFDRVVRVAWTIADCDGHDRPDTGDIAEAIDLRTRRAA